MEVAEVPRRIQEMAIVTVWVVGLLWVARQVTQRVPVLAPISKVLP